MKIITGYLAMVKKEFIMVVNDSQIPVLGHTHRNVAVKYLMKRRRSLLMTKDPVKVENLYTSLPSQIMVKSKRISRAYNINWERVGTENFEGSRFPFTISEQVIVQT
ncbi:MAG TPA: hypothetical protein VFG77_03100 [Nitrososphaeraceae archaeon]|jgi:hypothetical protein|nr:hypothetical protein [Nitrososphaeraceae archaeon]